MPIYGINSKGDKKPIKINGIVGPTGPQGIQGPTGPMGPMGPKGEDKNEIYVGSVNDEEANAEGIELVLDLTEIDGELYIDGSEGNGLTSEQVNQLTTAYEHSQSPHVSSSDIPTKTSELTNDNNYATESYVETKIYEASLGGASLPECFITVTGGV